MGWFDGWFGGGDGSSDSSDPLRKLDPKLREYLEKESPIKYSTAAAAEEGGEEQQGSRRRHQPQPQPLQQSQSQSPQPKTTTTQKPQTGSSNEDKTGAGAEGGEGKGEGVPSESLFQDGRYAHLWKGYKPLAAVEAETKTDHEKLMDVLEGYKERKAQIGKAALENCAEEQMDWNLCMKSGEWTSRMTMCRKEVQRFERCYMTQARLLKALGYLSSYQRPPEVDEQIQMRADAIFHKMLDQEAAAEKAKAEGLPVPSFPPLIPKTTTTTPSAVTPTATATTEMNGVPMEPGPNTLKEWEEKLQKLPEQDRAAEREALHAEFRAKAEVAGRIRGIWEEQAKSREARKAEGKETVSDKFKGLFGK